MFFRSARRCAESGISRERLRAKAKITRSTAKFSSESLSASNIYLKGLNVNADVTGQGSMYEANGKAIAQLLTFEDFKIDYPQMVGMIRGNGTDFKLGRRTSSRRRQNAFRHARRTFYFRRRRRIQGEKIRRHTRQCANENFFVKRFRH